MRLRAKVVGTLNLFMAQPRPLTAADIAVAQALAHAASIAILQDHAARDTRNTVGQFQHALNSRIAIEQAKGVLSERAGITMDEAFTRLRAHARSHNLKLSTLATSLADRTLPEARIAEVLGTTVRGTSKHPTR